MENTRGEKIEELARLERDHEILSASIDAMTIHADAEVEPAHASRLPKGHCSNEQKPDQRFCKACTDRQTDQCPGPALCGKTVLYVGGIRRMVPYYRQLIERHGGQFLHHDGGKEIARRLLPSMSTCADAVFCPIDCVSHDACHCVKKFCKRYQKPFVPMRSASLSALARGLGKMMQ